MQERQHFVDEKVLFYKKKNRPILGMGMSIRIVIVMDMLWSSPSLFLYPGYYRANQPCFMKTTYLSSPL